MKRFYKQATADSVAGGYVVALDGRAIKTPARETLILPHKAMADAIAAEWNAQGDIVDPKSMGLTQLANTCMDRVRPRRTEVLAEVTRYAETDLLCYQVGDEPTLRDQQATLWTPVLTWFEQQSGLKLAVTDGIMPVAQPDGLADYVSQQLAALSDAELTGVHELTSGFGSLIMALALLAGEISFDQAWQMSILDHQFQVAKWGTDAEAEAALAVKHQATQLGWQFISLFRAG